MNHKIALKHGILAAAISVGAACGEVAPNVADTGADVVDDARTVPMPAPDVGSEDSGASDVSAEDTGSQDASAQDSGSQDATSDAAIAPMPPPAS